MARANTNPVLELRGQRASRPAGQGPAGQGPASQQASRPASQQASRSGASEPAGQQASEPASQQARGQRASEPAGQQARGPASHQAKGQRASELAGQQARGPASQQARGQRARGQRAINTVWTIGRQYCWPNCIDVLMTLDMSTLSTIYIPLRCRLSSLPSLDIASTLCGRWRRLHCKKVDSTFMPD